MKREHSPQLVCPTLNAGTDECVTMAHGEGGTLSRRLIQDRIVRALASPLLDAECDAAILPIAHGPLAVTTDSFVVSPLFFPGGDIGSLAVYGTANDLAVAGARPRWLTLSLILEEGCEFALLDRVLASVNRAAQQADVSIVCGDTKVVPRGVADRLFINTCGLGEIVEPPPPGASHLQPGDCLIVSGPIARHGIAVLAARENLGFDPAPTSDCAPLWSLVETLHAAGVQPCAMRDATRGGVAAVLHEWAAVSRTSLVVEEAALPLLPETRAACELLGLDPLHIANEGTLVAAVRASEIELALAAMQALTNSRHARMVGYVDRQDGPAVFVRRALGRLQPLDEPLGAPMPRIC